MLEKWALFRKYHVYAPRSEDVEVDTEALDSYPERGMPDSLVRGARIQGADAASEETSVSWSTALNPDEYAVPIDDGTPEASDA